MRPGVLAVKTFIADADVKKLYSRQVLELRHARSTIIAFLVIAHVVVRAREWHRPRTF